MMLPILISVSVAPMSYFFCASAPLLVAASTAMAAEKAPSRCWIADILVSPWSRLNVSCFFDWKHFAASPCIEYLSRVPIKKKPPATRSQGALFGCKRFAGIPYREVGLVVDVAADDVAEQ